MIAKRVLIAEDDPVAREVLTKHFTMRRYHVVSATNGIRLIEAASEGKFDLIVTDIMMPDLDGVTSAEVIKLSGTATPIIALTGLSPEDVVSFQNAFNKIFHKPINIDELFKYIDSL